jgi:nucleoside-diphosphate-sugar epimerase
MLGGCHRQTISERTNIAATRGLAMKSIVITGANGFIGRKLCEFCKVSGHDVVPLARSATAGDGALSWRLGERLPPHLRDVDAVIHLASATLVENRHIPEAFRSDVDGSRVLLESVRAARKSGRRIRFIFLSSQSSSPNAITAYGKSKWAIEGMLDQDDEIIVRPGLVYADQSTSVFALFERISRLPLVPVVSSRASIQPIHVQEVVECLAQIVDMDRPQRLFELGAIDPMDIRQAIRVAARRAGRAPPKFVPVPERVLRWGTAVFDRLFNPTPSLTERLNGLIALSPMDTRRSLEVLSRKLAPFE